MLPDSVNVQRVLDRIAERDSPPRHTTASPMLERVRRESAGPFVVHIGAQGTIQHRRFARLLAARKALESIVHRRADLLLRRISAPANQIEIERPPPMSSRNVARALERF